MRDLTKLPENVEAGRVRRGDWASNPHDPRGGAFHFALRAGQRVLVIASPGPEWEHVSVSMTGRSVRKRLPTWREMCEIKAIFWSSAEAVVQYHPTAAEYVDYFEALHLWRPLQAELPTPPPSLVGPAPRPAIEVVRGKTRRGARA